MEQYANARLYDTSLEIIELEIVLFI